MSIDRNCIFDFLIRGFRLSSLRCFIERPIKERSKIEAAQTRQFALRLLRSRFLLAPQIRSQGYFSKRSNGCNGVRSDFENVTLRNVKWMESGQKAVTNRYGET